jgi:hypothetical protein
MDDLNISPNQLYNVRCLLTAAIRKLSNERELGFTSGPHVAHQTLAEALVAYLD